MLCFIAGWNSGDGVSSPSALLEPGSIEPHGSSVLWAHRGGARASRPRLVSLATRAAGLAQKWAVLLLSLLCGHSFFWSSHLCFSDRK